LKSKRKSSKEKYRHQNNWLEEDDDDFDMETDLYRDNDSNSDFEEDDEY